MSIDEIKYLVTEAMERLEMVTRASQKSSIEMWNAVEGMAEWAESYGYDEDEIPGRDIIFIANGWNRVAEGSAAAAVKALNMIEWPEADGGGEEDD